MNRFAEVVEKVSGLSTEELEEIKQIVDKQLSDRRIDEIKEALTEAKKIIRHIHLLYDRRKFNCLIRK